MARTPEEAATALLAAVEAQDIALVSDLYAEDLTIWHSFTGQTQSRSDNLKLLASFPERGQYRYQVHDRIVSGPKVVQRQRLTVTSNDGTRTASLEAVMFLEVHAGKITAIHEYIDGEEVKNLRATMSAPVR